MQDALTHLTGERPFMADKPTGGPQLPAGFENFEKLYTVDEIAGYLRLNPATVRAHLADGLIRGVRLGREWRITESALRAFLNPDEIQ